MLILLDIDGTILHCGSAARESLARALSEYTGEQITLELADVAGSTDLGIIRDALERVGALDGNPETILAEVGKRYLSLLRREYPKRGDQHLYPGARDLIKQLHHSDDFRLGLLTGNLEEGARVKLHPFDIWDYFPFGAFGSDAMHRNDLPAIAWDKAREQLGEHYTPDETVIIGDTPRDALCAEVNGIRSIIICRRPHWRQEIHRYNPWRVLESTGNVAGILRVLRDG